MTLPSDAAERRAPTSSFVAGESLALVAPMLDRAPAGLAVLDEDLRFLWINHTLAELHGVAVEKHLGRTFAELVPGNAVTVSQHLARVLATGEPVLGVECPVTDGLGRQRLFTANFLPLDDHGRRRRVGLTLVEITERRRALDALAASEERFRLAARATRDVIWDWDVANDRVSVNEGITESFGYDMEAVGRSAEWWYAHIHPDDRDRIRASMEAVLAPGGGEFWSGEYRHERAGGGWAAASDRAYVVRDAMGRAVRMVGVTSDVSERVLAAEALRAGEQRFRGVFDSHMIGIGFWRQGRVTEANATLLQLLGYDRADLEAGMLVTPRLTPPEYLARDREGYAETLRTGSCTPYEKEFFRKDGSRVPVLVGGAMIGDDPDAVFFVLDITALRRAQEQVQAVQRMDAIGRLAGGVAHEVNNALQGVLGYAEFVLGMVEKEEARGRDLGGVQRQDVTAILRAANRAAAITRQLLAFSRRQLLQPTVMDANDVVADFSPMLRRALGPERELLLHPGGGPARVKVDRGQLEQVLLNLALNARDAMPNGGRLSVRVGTVEDGGRRWILLEVGDTGEGMDASTLERIFEPFFTTKPTGQGTGLGLAVVYGIVRQSGGTVACESAPGEGTTFRIRLPEWVELGGTGPAAPSTPPPGGSETVLVVDDDPMVRGYAARLLREHGYEVLEAPDGSVALELAAARRERLRLVLSDVLMPAVGGRALRDALAEHLPGVPVLYTSGYPGDDATRLGLLAELAPFIPKPFEGEALLRRVREMIGG